MAKFPTGALAIKQSQASKVRIRIIMSSVVIAGVLALQSSAGWACSRPSFTKAELKALPTSRINQRVLSQAITKETNYYRCTRGMRPLANDVKLISAARSHSRNMVRMNKLSHILPVSGSRTMKQRFERANVEVKKVRAENIGTEYRLVFGTGVFLIADQKNCKFTYRATRKPIPRHNYGSFARSVVKRWWDSRDHRKNILNRHIKRVGSAAEFTSKGVAPCGTFYVTQDLAG